MEGVAAMAIAEYVIGLSPYATASGVDDSDALRASLPAAKPWQRVVSRSKLTHSATMSKLLARSTA